MADRHVWLITIRRLVVAGSTKDNTMSILIESKESQSERQVVNDAMAAYPKEWWSDKTIADLSYVGQLRNSIPGNTDSIAIMEEREFKRACDAVVEYLNHFPVGVHVPDPRIREVATKLYDAQLVLWCDQFGMTVEDACQTLARVAMERKGGEENSGITRG